jgi:rubrerythrin
MALSQQLCGVLALGVQRERAARDFYAQAAEKVLLPLGKRMFKLLAAEEAKHEQLLASWSSAGACPAGVTFPEADKELLKRGKAKLQNEVKPDTGDIQAIEIGQDMERKSIVFYAEAAAKAEDQPSKELFHRLEGEERKHLVLLTDLFEYMRNPNLWTVRDERAHFDS